MLKSQVQGQLAAVVARAVKHRRVFGAVIAVQGAADAEGTVAAAGELAADTPYFIASTTKLYVAALVFALEDRGQLALDDPAARHLDVRHLRGLQRHGGEDHADALTVRQLLAHTSGIPDYFQGKPANSPSLLTELQQGGDPSWSFDEALERARTLPAPFAPGAGKKALYSDTNYQLLGRLVENLHDQPLAQVIEEQVARPLGLPNTYLFRDPLDTRPAPLRFGAQARRSAHAMASFGPDGGIVSTANESLRFVRAFFEGELFIRARLPSLYEFRRAFFPLDFGVGVCRFKVPWLFMPFGKRPELLGHSGLSGAFAFACPARNLYLAGTANQVLNPDLSFRMMLDALRTLNASPLQPR